MDYLDIVETITDILKELDSEKPVHRTYHPGIGPFGEPQMVKLIAQRLTSLGLSSQTKRTPDLDIQHQWAIEFKIVRPYGDNGKEAENWSVNLLHPYPGNASLIGDAIKLKSLDEFPMKGLFVIGYEHNPAKINLDPLLDSFEIITRQVIGINICERIEARREGLVHPEHQVLRCIGWQI